jgi:D-lactate dehydrogenase
MDRFSFVLWSRAEKTLRWQRGAQESPPCNEGRATLVGADFGVFGQNGNMKIAMFSAQEFEREFFESANERLSHEIVYYREKLAGDNAAIAVGFPAVCTFVTDRLDQITLSTLSKGGTRLILLRCAGFNNVDMSAAAELGMTVMHVPAYSPNAVAEHAVALMLALNRNLHRAYNRAREGNFDLNSLVGFDVFGKTVGIVGTGRIGAAFGRIMAGFGCRLLGYDVYHDPTCVALGMEYVDLGQLLQRSDVVSLHCLMTPENRHLINTETISLMKRGSMLINTSRGGLVDTSAVLSSLKTREHLWYFGLDVYEYEEPIFFADRSSTIIQDDLFERLTTLPGVIITGHQAFLTREALTNIADTTLANASEFERGSLKLENRVTPAPA